MPIITTAARCLEETVKSGSIRKAAEVLNLSASAVNRHILNLEAEYGLQLLERLPRGVVATEAGRLLMDRLCQWRSELTQTVDALGHLRGRGRQHLNIGTNECVAQWLLPQVTRALLRQNPGLSLSVTVGGSDELTAALVAGQIEAVVAFNLRRSADFWIVSGTQVPIGVITPPGHPLAAQDTVPLDDCARHPLILADGSLTLRPVLDTLFRNKDPGLTQVITSNSIMVIKRAILDGFGISVLTPLDVAPERAAGTLCYLPLENPALFETLSIGVREVRDMAPGLKAFCDAMTGAIHAALAAAGATPPPVPPEAPAP